jgi:cell shape-determining protein MreC
MIKFNEPIDEKRRDEIIEAIANRVKQFGMTVPAIFFLEMNKPLSYIGGQAMHFFAPIIGVFFNTFEDYAYFFDQRENLELLIQRLEAIAADEEDERKKQKALKKEARKAKKDIEVNETRAGSSMLDDALKMDPGEKSQSNEN